MGESGPQVLSTTPIKEREGQIQTITPIHHQDLMALNPPVFNAASTH
jgi:hypothetical protein